jgi:polyferredoxin
MLEKYFAPRKKLYSQNVKGRFRSLKSRLNLLFLGIYCLSPFIRFDRGPSAPNQAILIDITNSKIYFFFIELLFFFQICFLSDDPLVEPF